jgi:hypothetical protein
MLNYDQNLGVRIQYLFSTYYTPPLLYPTLSLSYPIPILPYPYPRPTPGMEG